jgi:replicative DNA helicase
MTFSTRESGARRLESTGRRTDRQPNGDPVTTVPAAFTGGDGDISRIPPQDTDAEQAVLGSIMLSRDALDDVAEIVTGRDFYRPAHETIYRTALDLHARGERVDPITLAAELTRRGELARVGGASYLHTLVNAVPTAANAEYYAEIIREKAVLRRIVEAGTRIAQLGFDQCGDLDEIRGAVEAEIHAALMNRGDELPYTYIGDGIEPVIDELQARQNGSMDTQGILTGLYDLDGVTGGFKGGQLIVIGARPAMGKSTLALDFARAAAFRQNVPVAFFSLEMGQRELIKRTLSAEGRVALHHIEHANLTEDDWHKIAVVHSSIKGEHPDPDGAPLIIDDSPNLTLATIQSRARRMQRRHHIGMVIVDYLQLLTAGTGKRHQPRHEEVAELSRNLKLMAKELDVPVIALSQLNRGPEQTADKVPMLSHLRESGAVEQDADIVILLHREDAYDKESARAGEADLIIAKHRGGPTTTVTAAAQLHYSRFANMSPEPEGYHMPRRETPAKAPVALPTPRPVPSANQDPAAAHAQTQPPASSLPADDLPAAAPVPARDAVPATLDGRRVADAEQLAGETGEHQDCGAATGTTSGSTRLSATTVC